MWSKPTAKFALLALVIQILIIVCQAQAPLKLQQPGIKQTEQDKQRAEEVKTAFTGAFDDYMKYGFPGDKVRPLSKTARNTGNGWSATLVDALDTLFVMNLQDRFTQGVAETLKIDFSRSQTDDVTIRYIAGILSAYKLSGATNAPLLDQARELGDKLLVCWQDDQQNLPFPFLDFTTNKPVMRDYISAASAGSLVMEFDWLSFHTCQPKYLQYATKAAQTVIKTPSALPGLPGLIFGVKNQTILNDLATWGSGTEYLLKYGMLIGNSDPSYSWKQAVQSSIKKLIQVSPVQNLTYLGDFSALRNIINLEFSHLACYASGNWILGGKVFQDSQTFDYALRLLTTCMETYKQTVTGLGPEIFRFLGPNGENSGNTPSPQDVEFSKAIGFYITNAAYHLRPEVIKSAFYAWQLTGDVQYQEFVWQAFKSLQKYCKAVVSYSDIENVNSNSNPQPKDASKSFLYAKTFKYIYLTFLDPELLSLDQYAFS
ncbi:hypothetical protein PSTG_05287 [Puccinia striiformis f. sp. tritici PST-78]|uniref:alpha-1,2-Mannosidase n=1 Tax=Puccinia striiformis f. sp. tritici PST-78 TaxID=1165861 RepID=A0A0L0VQN9_9BASI|nr:hypothetical protein PSTG_05287 [Puccinia striiformis f. sp. tritici PST-78]